MEIEEVRKLDRVMAQLYPNSQIKEPRTIYACISKPDTSEPRIRYVLLASVLPEPNHGFAYLGEIDPKTKVFKFYDDRGQGVSHVEYKNGVICSIYLPGEQKGELNTIDQLLSILE
jgi:hypothetical protein